MAKIEVYLHFDGTCAQALKFYEQALGAKIAYAMRYDQQPDPSQVPPDSGDRILHSNLQVGDQMLMASDVPAGYPVSNGGGISVSLHYADVAEAKQVFAALSEGGTVKLPGGETFWAPFFGMVVDRFGTPWMVGAGETKSF